jgi:hypothetical protein
MSKLSRQLCASLASSSIRRAVPSVRAAYAEDSVCDTVQSRSLRHHALRVEFYAAGVALEPHDEERVAALRRQLVAQVLEDVFGEFRPLLMDVNRALARWDVEAAQRALAVLEAALFEVEA